MHDSLKQKAGCICLLILMALHLHAQCLTLKHLNSQDGLSNNYVVDITQDSLGFLWFATEEGLNRFDGRCFTQFVKSNSGISSDELNTLLYIPEENELWIGTQRNGISILDCNHYTFSHLTASSSSIEKRRLVTNDVTHLARATDGGIWITHYHVGVEHYDIKKKELTVYRDNQIPGMKSKNWCACDDGKGNLYIGHAFEGMSIVNLAEGTATNFQHNPTDPHSIPGNEVHCIYIDSKRHIWIGTDQGVSLFNPQAQTFTNFIHNPTNPHSLISDAVFDIKEMDKGTLWISTEMGGISILDLEHTDLNSPEKAQFRNLISGNHPEGLSSAYAHTLFQDSFHNIWIGHYQSGIDFINAQEPFFKILAYPTDTRYSTIGSMCMDSQDQVWIGRENEIARTKGTQVLETYRLRTGNGLQHIPVNTLIADQEDNIWIGTYHHGIWLKRANENKFIPFPLFPEHQDVRTFHQDRNGKLWIGTEEGLYSYYKGILSDEPQINSQLPDVMIHSLLTDHAGKLWIGTFGKGICIFDTQNVLIANISDQNGLPSNAINRLYQDSRLGIWAGTRNGLVHFPDQENPSRLTVMKEEKGLNNMHIRSIQEDQQGKLWISTNNGISVWENDRERFINFNSLDGIPNGNFVNEASCITSDGTLYFGTQGGICHFHPSNKFTKDYPDKVQISDFELLQRIDEATENRTPVPYLQEKIKLPHNQNSFRISFIVPNFGEENGVEYAYTLKGLENVWYNTYNENQVTFRSLPPGNYVFKVKARLRHRPWNEKDIATVSIEILPPIWGTTYAIIIYILIIGIIVYSILRFYKRKLNLEYSLEVEKKKNIDQQELNNERLRFYTNITHELRTPLTLILGPLENLLQDTGMPNRYQEKLSKIYNSAQQLLELINRLLEFRKVETQNRKLCVMKGDISRIFMETGLRYKECNQNINLDFHIQIHAQETMMYFDPTVITVILNNLLSNAVKYTSQGEIEMTLRNLTEQDVRYTEMEIKDTGCGIEADMLPHIFDRYFQVDGKHQASGTGIGLALVKTLVELHEGSLQVASTPGKGSSFTFRLRTENTYPKAQHKEENLPVESPVTETYQYDEKGNILSVLIIEDNTELLEYISLSLSRHYHTLTARNGQEGLTVALKEMPNIIISDIMMPVMDGITLCKYLKKNIHTCHIPIILLTAKDDIIDKTEGYESGADSYVTKPFSIQLLHSRIQNILKNRKKLINTYINQHAENAEQTATNATENKGNVNTEKTEKLSRLDQEFLNKLINFIENNITQEKMEIAYIASNMNMSHSTLYRKIKALTGMTANEFVRHIRIQYSIKLLKTKEYNVSEAAFSCGINDLAYFRQCFKEEMGVSPSEFLKGI